MEICETSTQWQYCSIQSCINSKGTTSNQFHFFKPLMEKPILEKWKEAIGQHQKIENITSVCNLHFDSKSLFKMDGKLYLKRGSVPSIFRPFESEIQNEVVSVKTEPISDEISNTVRIVNINEIIQNAPQIKNELTSELTYNVGSAICSGCLERDDKLEKLKIELEQERKFTRHWKSIAMQYMKRMNTAMKEQAKEVNGRPIENMDVDEAPAEGSTTIAFVHGKEIKIQMKNGSQRKIRTNTFNNFECFVCKKPFPSSVSLRRHMKMHTKKYTCVVCHKRYTIDQNDRHVCNHQQSISCEYCSQAFNSTKQLLDHLKTAHSDETKMYTCLECNKIFAMVFLKDTHERSHDTIKPSNCNICSKSYANQALLKRHQKREHRNQEEPKIGHLCDQCGKEFRTQKTLAEHMQRHDEPTFKCPSCPAVFHTNVYLHKHSHVHRKIKYVCSVCGAELSSPMSLRKHIIHVHNSSTKSIECKICTKVIKKQNFKKHMQLHGPRKAFQCSFCDNSYKHNGDLNKHQRIHLGEKMYECKEAGCSEHFRLNVELQKHSFEHYKDQQN